MERYFGPGPGAQANGDMYGFEMYLFHTPGASSYAILMTNASEMDPASDSPARFARVAGAVEDLLLVPWRRPASP